MTHIFTLDNSSYTVNTAHMELPPVVRRSFVSDLKREHKSDLLEPTEEKQHLGGDPSELQHHMDDLQKDIITSVLLDQSQAYGQEPDMAKVHPGLHSRLLVLQGPCRFLN